MEHWFHTSLPLLKSHALTLREVAGTKMKILGAHFLFGQIWDLCIEVLTLASKLPNVHCRWENGKREWQNKNHLIATRNAYTQEKNDDGLFPISSPESNEGSESYIVHTQNSGLFHFIFPNSWLIIFSFAIRKLKEVDGTLRLRAPVYDVQISNP